MNLSNQTQDTINNNSTIFDTSFEMIKTDGTSKHRECSREPFKKMGTLLCFFAINEPNL